MGSWGQQENDSAINSTQKLNRVDTTVRLGHLSPKFWRKIEITVELRFVLGHGSQTSGSYKCPGVFV